MLTLYKHLYTVEFFPSLFYKHKFASIYEVNKTSDIQIRILEHSCGSQQTFLRASYFQKKFGVF